METVVLEKTIIKIGSLLALGFGEAGAEIIGQNMQGSDTSALNAMIPGRRVEALFGFCDIRNFTDATEVLQDQVMLFVNRIAGVVHSCINEFFGSPNKNVGDAFLLVWRLTGHNSRKQQRLADMSLISFVKIIATINKSPLLAEYRSHPKLVKRLPNYRVRLGFGLHSGWAIEGAIGSEFKIDASYLSPNVNMAARLEGVTKQYGCLILISEALVKLCSEPIAQECRLIDHVAMTGTKGAFKLFTMDLDDLALEVDRVPEKEPQGRAGKYKAKYERQRKKNERWGDDFDLYHYFSNERDIRTMRNKFSTEFFCRFNMAYLNYEAGNWSVAKSMLEATRFLLATEDGPSAALLRYMKYHCTPDGGAPEGWRGYRVLNDK
jgi:class 3 adenylate cyclase